MRAIVQPRYTERPSDRWLGNAPSKPAIMSELIEAGRPAPVIDRTFPLAGVPQAIRYLEAGRALGRIVITVS